MIEKAFRFFDSVGMPIEVKAAFLEAVIEGYLRFFLTAPDRNVFSVEIPDGKIVVRTGGDTPRIKFSVEFRGKVYDLNHKICAPYDLAVNEIYADIFNNGYRELGMRPPDDVEEIAALTLRAAKSSLREIVDEYYG